MLQLDCCTDYPLGTKVWSTGDNPTGDNPYDSIPRCLFRVRRGHCRIHTGGPPIARRKQLSVPGPRSVAHLTLSCRMLSYDCGRSIRPSLGISRTRAAHALEAGPNFRWRDNLAPHPETVFTPWALLRAKFRSSAKSGTRRKNCPMSVRFSDRRLLLRFVLVIIAANRQRLRMLSAATRLPPMSPISTPTPGSALIQRPS